MSPNLWKTTKEKIFTLRSLLFIFCIGVIYIILSTFLLNYRLVFETIIGNFSISYKTTLLTQLILGIFTSLSPLDSIFLFFNGFFVGLNALLITKTIRSLEHMGKVRLTVGGATIIGLVTAGCGACGFTIFSLLGLSTSLYFLPFHGMEVHILILCVLVFSSVYMIRKLVQARICSLY